MSDQNSLSIRSARLTHAAALAPRLLLCATLAVLALAGIRSILRHPTTTVVTAAPQRADLAAEAFAASFVRDYLSWSPSGADEHAQRMAAYLAAGAVDGDPLTPGRTAQRVSWTAVEQDSGTSGGVREVVVEAATTAGTAYVSVPVARDSSGLLYVAHAPALVGPPGTDTHAPVDAEPQVSDVSLVAVLQRAVRNYLGGDGSDLRADLAPEAAVSLPSQPLTLRSIDELTWSGPGRAAAQLTAGTPDGSVWTLRYELGVVKRDRWYVSAIANSPAQKEGN